MATLHQTTFNNLLSYVRSVKDNKFELGTFDCLTFSNSCYKIIHGHGWADEWLGRYVDESGKIKRNVKKDFGFPEFEDLIDSKLTRGKTFPSRGDIVSHKHIYDPFLGIGLGVSFGNRFFAPSDNGLVQFDISEIEAYWET